MVDKRVCKLYLDSFNNLLIKEGMLWNHGSKSMFVIGKPWMNSLPEL